MNTEIVTCPRCGRKIESEVYYNLTYGLEEQHINCESCGYYYDFVFGDVQEGVIPTKETRTLIVNLLGGAGAGKSTGAAYIFSQLKLKGIEVELVTEFAKDKVWENANEALDNQAYVFGQQYHRISRVYNKVDVIITDSPLILSMIYNSKKPPLDKYFNDMVLNVFKWYPSANYFIERVKPYNNNGRIHTEKESNEVADLIKDVLNKNYINYEVIPGNKEGYDKIVQYIMAMCELTKIINKEEN